MTERNEDERLTRWIAATRAEADPALWTRVRATIEAREARPELPAWLGWLARPAGLATAAAVLALVCGAGLYSLRPSDSAGVSSSSASLTETLLEEAAGIDVGTPEPETSPGDTGVTG